MASPPAAGYVPPAIRDLGTLPELTAAHMLLPTHVGALQATSSLSGASVPGGHHSSGGPGGPGITTTTPSTQGSQPSHHFSPVGAGSTPTGNPSASGGPGASGSAPSGGLGLPAAPGGVRSASGQLPFTGYAATLTAGIGAAAAGAGAALRRATRRRSA